MDAQLAIGVVEDNDDLRESLVEVLRGLGYRAAGFSCAEDLDESPGIEFFELMILDLNLPGEDGLSLASRLRRARPSLRLIMMTTRISLGDRVRGYDVGADLYLPKPVDEDELLAAVRSLARQIRSDSLEAAEVSTERLWLDLRAMRLHGPLGEASLRQVDVALLSVLARAPGQRLEHWQLIEAVGLDQTDAGKANLAVKMTRLRAKLGQAGCSSGALRSLRASGYQLCVPLEIR